MTKNKSENKCNHLEFGNISLEGSWRGIECMKCNEFLSQEDTEKVIDTSSKHDPVNSPSHYTSDPSGVECIQVTRHRNFNIGNAIKYLWRAGLKDEGLTGLDKQIQDLQKAIFYINDEIKRLEGES